MLLLGKKGGGGGEGSDGMGFTATRDHLCIMTTIFGRSYLLIQTLPHNARIKGLEKYSHFCNIRTSECCTMITNACFTPW